MPFPISHFQEGDIVRVIAPRQALFDIGFSDSDIARMRADGARQRVRSINTRANKVYVGRPNADTAYADTAYADTRMWGWLYPCMLRRLNYRFGDRISFLPGVSDEKICDQCRFCEDDLAIVRAAMPGGVGVVTGVMPDGAPEITTSYDMGWGGLYKPWLHPNVVEHYDGPLAFEFARHRPPTGVRRAEVKVLNLP